MLLYSYFYNNILWLFNRISIHNIHFLYLLIPLICLGKEHLKNNVSQVNFQTHLGVILDAKLTFEEHLKNVFNKTNKMIGLLKKLSNLLPRQALVTIYKAFIRPHLDYGDVLYDQAFNNSFHTKMESIQYNACLAITRAIRGMSREKIYQELGLEPLQLCCWYRKLCLFYKVFKNEHPEYLFHLIPVRCTSYATRTESNIPLN